MIVRIRSAMWFVAGVAAGLVGLAGTTARTGDLPGPDQSAIIAVDPARILDTRDTIDVGLQGPFVSAVPMKLQVVGVVQTTSGPRTVVPVGATGVLLNVTVVSPTANGFVSIRPGDASGAPSTSSLNFEAGAIVPNSVQVAMPTAGAHAGSIDITYDAYGTPGPTTDILVDVVGYTMSSGLQEIITRLQALEAAQPFAVGDASSSGITLEQSLVTIAQVTVLAPVDGRVTLNAAADVEQLSGIAGDDVVCHIVSGSDAGMDLFFERDATANNGNVAGTRQFAIAAGETKTYRLQCRENGNGGFVYPGAELTAIFTAN